jgi:hypothetical protein
MVKKLDLRRGLDKIVNEIGTNYKLPQGEFLESEFGLSDNCRNPFFGQEPSKVKFSFGTQKEVNIWLTEHNSENDKYPLVWLVYPIFYKSKAGDKQVQNYRSIRLLFAINNEIDPSAEQRVSTTEYILQQISDKFIDLLAFGDVANELTLDKTSDVQFGVHINYTSSGQNDYVLEKTAKQPSTAYVDNWDVYVLDLDISLRRENC